MEWHSIYFLSGDKKYNALETIAAMTITALKEESKQLITAAELKL